MLVLGTSFSVPGVLPCPILNWSMATRASAEHVQPSILLLMAVGAQL
jgi:hypothetical protein